MPCSSLFVCGKTLGYSQAVLYSLSSIVSRLKTMQSPPLWLSDGEHDGLIHLLSDDGEYDGLICPAPAPRTQPVNHHWLRASLETQHINCVLKDEELARCTSVECQEGFWERERVGSKCWCLTEHDASGTWGVAGKTGGREALGLLCRRCTSLSAVKSGQVYTPKWCSKVGILERF